MSSDSEDESKELTQEQKKWHILYPLFFDSTKSRKHGRIMPSNLCIPEPTAEEIADACKELNLPFVLEPGKKHPREFFLEGRVRVNFKSPKDEKKPRTPLREDIPSKLKLEKMVAEIMKNRRTEKGQKQKSTGKGKRK
ncbi:putative signal recognition particle subunit SRP19 [Monocercomonoides exilis]|uniref:putative signal recognition particle subunit SRP19 n=1 Tax=Monocercomonoides exilis TaxID=2049356 RepID=UPI00355A7830|nr:putative signal recognition particle subunit SRP19 [Monocercomonoides exilis]|eukprot:MONOS_11548.1-p1 / transcript=MONOS_11548.1 / gene=MONOS_11548 / organism=Monocercomonoides_exilis_PA203 / gene_product=unspecified product / transcript_product=unspecified product / location=Mono_scaffold00585:37115-37691(+) / protein_length=137 / sequence_SO=supercontig / SO=protein_coding / is_pseudo=false